MPAACPALEDTCPVCPTSALCELVAGGWPLTFTPALEGMPAPEMPQTRPVALTAPVESRLGPPPPPPQPQPPPLAPAGPRRIVWRNGPTGNGPALNHDAQYPVKTAAAPAVLPGKRPLPGIAMPFMTPAIWTALIGARAGAGFIKGKERMLIITLKDGMPPRARVGAPGNDAWTDAGPSESAAPLPPRGPQSRPSAGPQGRFAGPGPGLRATGPLCRRPSIVA